MRTRAGLVALAVSAAALTTCGKAVSPTVTTGLRGVVVRGPIAPVCQIEVPCDAPFSATFSVEQGGRLVTQFRSDNDGHFTVIVPAGTYRIVPGADAPIMSPQSQAKTVEVLPVGLTNIRLEFDTGIRLPQAAGRPARAGLGGQENGLTSVDLNRRAHHVPRSERVESTWGDFASWEHVRILLLRIQALRQSA